MQQQLTPNGKTPLQLYPGALWAYLEGEASPPLEEALRKSPVLQAELAELRTVKQYLENWAAHDQPFDLQELVEVAAGLSTPEQKRRISTLAQRNPTLQAEFATLQTEWARLNAPT